MVKIRLIEHSNINYTKWDQCIARSINGIVYAYSWYLDIVAGAWDALIEGDYEVVFPLIPGKKYGLAYLYQPYFTQQLGIFSPRLIDTQHAHRLIDAVPSKYRYISINFNTFNSIEYPGALVSDRVTYQLDLIQPYATLASKYSDNTRRNILKSVALGVSVAKGLQVDDLLNLKRKNLAVTLSSKHFGNLKQIIAYCLSHGMGEIYGAYTPGNELCAAAFFMQSNGKAIYLLAASTPEGRERRAMFAIIDYFISMHSESHLILDFEGSQVESIARFYAGFGATPCTYQNLQINRLPWYLKPLRR
jgi:hypothetical protein